MQSREACEVNGCLGMACAAEYALFLRVERVDMSRTAEV